MAGAPTYDVPRRKLWEPNGVATKHNVLHMHSSLSLQFRFLPSSSAAAVAAAAVFRVQPNRRCSSG